ncbi:MAG: glycosyltransferase [Phycisphaerae bacterium]
MRVWFLTPEWPEPTGDIAAYTATLARALGAAGHEALILAPAPSPCDQELAPNVRLIGLASGESPADAPQPQPTSATGRIDLASACPQICPEVARSHHFANEVLRLLTVMPAPDVIEAPERDALLYYLLQRKLTERGPLRSIPIIVRLHGGRYDLTLANQGPCYRFPAYWVGQMERFCAVAADALLSTTHVPGRALAAALARSMQVDVIPPLVTASEVGPLNPAQPLELLCPGPLEWRRGVVELVRTCDRLWSAGREFRLTLLGADGHFPPRDCMISTLIERRQQTWLERGLLTVIADPDPALLREHLRQAWAVVIPSRFEGFSSPAADAMAVGQVLLASRQSGAAELINEHGNDGFLFDWDTPGDLEQRLAAVLALDPARRTATGERAQARVAALCAPDVVLPQRLAHYERIRQRRGPRGTFPVVRPPMPDAAAAAAPAQRPPLGEPGLVSVIVPFYNLGEYIGETLRSALASTHTPLEVVIVDDGSTDPDSLAALDEIDAQHLPNVRIAHTENQGLPSARNAGVDAARGEFIALLDADDLIEPGFLAHAVDVLRRYANVGFVYSWVRYFGDSSGIWPTWNAEFPYLLGHNMLAAFVVMRRTDYLRWGRQQPEFAYNFEDYAGWIGLLAAGAIGVSLPHPYALYRIRGNSMWRSANPDQVLYLYELLTRRYPAAYRHWGPELFNLQNANGSGRLWNHPARESSGEQIDHLLRERDLAWTEARRLAQGWEHQKDFIDQQAAYIKQLTAERDQLAGQLQALTGKQPTEPES